MKLMQFFSHKKFDDLGQPQPIKNFLPKWWRDAESSVSTGEPGLKKCVPFMDAMLSGYTLTLPYDVFVLQLENGEVKLSWSGPKELPDFISERRMELGATMPRPAGHAVNHLVFKGIWGMKTPRGWSLLITHPLNRFDLPFTTMSGIIDSDEFTSPGNIPFFVKEGFSGMIPKGTPIAQLIPIKRASWQMVPNNHGLLGKGEIESNAVREPGKSYKKLMWHRKDYN